MKKYSLVRASLAHAMTLVLLLPGFCLADGKEGKKHFKEGIKQESAESWDQAAQQYALAVAEEPGNTEYRLRMLRASRMAALMYASRGDALAAGRDYEGAYNAYARAYSYDPTQETMRLKMERMLEQRKAQSGMGEAGQYNPRTGVLLPASNEIRPAASTRPRQEALQKTDGNPVTVTTGTSTSLASLGGLGLASVSAISGNVFGLGSGLGTIIGLPPSSLSLLQSKGKSRLLASTQIHALDGEQNQTVVGRSVPVRTGTSYLGAYTGVATGTTGSLTGSSTVDNIQYRDVGLVIDVQPVITSEGYVQIKMKLESSNVEASGTDSQLTPAFTKRSLTTISRVQDSVTAVVASVKQDSSGDSRASIPVIGMLPILGRLFTAPKQSNSRSDIVITVTPHIIRPSEIKPEDHLARFSGTQQSGFTMSVEEVVHRAEHEEEQERRLIAGDRMLTPLPAVEKGSDATSIADKGNENTPRPRVVSAGYTEKAPVKKAEPVPSTGQPNRENRP